MQRPKKSPPAKLLALTLTFAMLLGIAITAAAAPAYPDISGHWGETAIEKWSAYDVLHGNDLGTFDPDGELDVTQLAQILVNTFGYTESFSGTLPDYTNVWGEEAVRKAVAAGVIEAGEASLPLTRELAAKIVAKAFGISPTQGTSKFADDYAISFEYKPYAAALGRAGIFNGNDYGEFMPSSVFSRAAIMQALDNAVTDIAGENKAAGSAKSVIINKTGITLTEGTIEGDLIIAQGVGDGDVTLDSVTVKGRLVIFGGGSNSIHIIGKSDIPNIVIAKTFGQAARVIVESVDAVVGTVTVAAESKAAVATANGAGIAKVEIAPKTEVSKTGEVAVVTADAAAAVTISAKVENLAVETKATITVASGAVVSAATVEASDVKISGAGKLTAVTVTADAKSGVEIRTSGTKVTVDKDAGAVTTSTGKIEPGKTATTDSSSSFSGGSYYGPTTPGTPDPEPEATITVSAGLSPAVWGTVPAIYSDYTVYEVAEDAEEEPAEEVGDVEDESESEEPIEPTLLTELAESDSGEPSEEPEEIKEPIYWIDGSDGYTQDELTVSGGKANYFVKAVYGNYDWDDAVSTLGIIVTTDGVEPDPDHPGENYVFANSEDEKLYVDTANKTIYYFGELTIAVGDEDSGWFWNAELGEEYLSVFATIMEADDIIAAPGTLEIVAWPAFESYELDLTEDAAIPAGGSFTLPVDVEPSTFTVVENKSLAIGAGGKLVVPDTVELKVTGTLEVAEDAAVEIADGAIITFDDDTSKLDGAGKIAVGNGGELVAPADGISWETESEATIEYTAGATATFGDTTFIGSKSDEPVFELTTGTITQGKASLTIDVGGEAIISEYEIPSENTFTVNGTLDVPYDAALTFAATDSELGGIGTITVAEGGVVTFPADGIVWADTTIKIVYEAGATAMDHEDTFIGSAGAFELTEGAITQSKTILAINGEAAVSEYTVAAGKTLEVNGTLEVGKGAALTFGAESKLAGTGTVAEGVTAPGIITVTEGTVAAPEAGISWGKNANVKIVYGSDATLEYNETEIIGESGAFTISTGTITQSAAGFTIDEDSEVSIPEGTTTVKGTETLAVAGALEVTGSLAVEGAITFGADSELGGTDGTITVADGGTLSGPISGIIWGEKATVTITYEAGATSVFGGMLAIGNSESPDCGIRLTGGNIIQSKDAIVLDGDYAAASIEANCTITEDFSLVIKGDLAVAEDATLTISEGGTFDVSLATEITIAGELVIEADGVLDAGDSETATELFNALGVESAAGLADEAGVELILADGAKATLFTGAIIKLTPGQAEIINAALSGAGVEDFIFEENGESGVYTLKVAEPAEEEEPVEIGGPAA
jgi:hypothetical protein